MSVSKETNYLGGRGNGPGSTLDSGFSSWLQDRGNAAVWADVTNLALAFIQTLRVSSLLELRIVPCLVNGIACGTALYQGAVWKLERLRRLREFVQGGGGGLAPADAAKKIKEWDDEKDAILGKDFGKAWDIVMRNLKAHKEAQEQYYIAARKAHDDKAAEGYNHEVVETNKIIDAMEKEGRPQ